jgi:diguanylate cyclase (GGDEF)-like protein
VISPDQARRVREAHLDLDTSAQPYTVLALRLDAILDAKVAVFVKRNRRWRTAAESSAEPAIDAGDALATSLDRVSASPSASLEFIACDRPEWTLIACTSRPAAPAVIGIQGDWTLSAPTLIALARNVSLSLGVRAMRSRSVRRVATHRLARLLARTAGRSEVAALIVSRGAAAVSARLAALALPDVADGRLSIVATHGYPLALVEHLRIEPGDGIIGTVFQSGAVWHADHADRIQRSRRPRYRTGSFIAFPIRAGREIVGVFCATDRADNEPFTQEDVSAIRALMAPAALALARDRALVQAESYAHAATLDALTGAFNRRYFQVRLDEELERSRRHRIPLALLMVDVDDFKAINDSFGHLAGDAVLRDIAEILRRSIRVFDICARFGGEEFAIIMPGSGADSASKIAERIRERIESYRPTELPLRDLRVTASVGLAVSTVDVHAHDLVAGADQALYIAKRGGKNRVGVYEPPS